MTETIETTRQRIVVGYDGSEASQVALTWALGEANARRAPVLIVHVLDTRADAVADETFTKGSSPQDRRQAAQRMLLAAEHESRREVPEVEVGSRVVEGETVPQLLEQLSSALMVVVGGGGLGEVAQLLVGSTGVQLVSHSPCPVVVVRSLEYVPPGPEAGQIVVGVDGADRSSDVLAFAFDEASLRGTGVTALHAWQEPFAELPAYRARNDAALLADLDREAHELLDDLLQPWREKYPDVPVRVEVVHGEPARALVHVSPGAALVVVGSRGRRGFATLLLGSVGHGVVHHARSAVALVRHRSVV